MGIVDRIYLDTNVFIIAVERPETSDLHAADHLIDLFSSKEDASGFELHTSDLSLSELLVAPYKAKDTELIETYEAMLSGGFAVRTSPVTRSVLRRAAAFRGMLPSIKLPDAVHLATAFDLKCQAFLTADADLRAKARLLEVPFRSEPLSEAALSNLVGARQSND